MIKNKIIYWIFGLMLISSSYSYAENFLMFDMWQPYPDTYENEIISSVYTFWDWWDTWWSPSNIRAIIFQDTWHPLTSSDQCQILINWTDIWLWNEINVQPGDTYQFKIKWLDNDPIFSSYETYLCTLWLRFIPPGWEIQIPGASAEFTFLQGYSYPTITPPTPSNNTNFKLDQWFLNDFRDAQITSSKNWINNWLSITSTVTWSLTLLAFIVIWLSIFIWIIIYIINKKKTTF